MINNAFHCLRISLTVKQVKQVSETVFDRCD